MLRSFGGAQTSRGGSVSGKWLGDHKGSSTLDDNSCIYGNRIDVVLRDIIFLRLRLWLICLSEMLNEGGWTGLG